MPTIEITPTTAPGVAAPEVPTPGVPSSGVTAPGGTKPDVISPNIPSPGVTAPYDRLVPDFTMEGPVSVPNTVGPAKPKGPINAIRGDQPLTTSAMLGCTINSHPVYVIDIFRPINGALEKLAASDLDTAEFRARAKVLISNQIQSYKNDILLSSAAENTLTDHDQQLISAVLEKERFNLISKNGGSIPAADKALAPQGSSVEKEMADKRRQMIMGLYLQKNVSPKIVVTYPMVRDAYEKDPKKWQRETQVELYQLTLPVVRWLTPTTSDGKKGPPIADPTPAQVTDAENKAMQTARDIIALLKKGPDTPQLFAQLVEDYDSRDGAASKGGRLPDMKKGSISDSRLETYVFSLPAHTIGEPQLLRDPNPQKSRVVIVKIGDKEEAHTVPFADAQADIRKDLWEREAADLQEEYLRKLQDSSTVEAVDQMIDVAVDAAVARYATDR